MKPTVRVLSTALAKDIRPKPEGANALLCRYEEYATLYLWAYPQLLGWQRDIKWLFSPVTGKDRYPGDLWGVDSAGDLILVETKLARTNRGQDPFVDFIAFEASRAKELKVTAIRRRWEQLLGKERHFIEQYQKELEEGKIPNRLLPGVVPYSSQRSVVRQWRHLYLDVILPEILARTSYDAKIEAYLDNRKVGSPIHYFGLVAVSPNITPRLTAKGNLNYERLCLSAGMARVHFRGLRAAYKDAEFVELVGLG